MKRKRTAVLRDAAASAAAVKLGVGTSPPLLEEGDVYEDLEEASVAAAAAAQEERLCALGGAGLDDGDTQMSSSKYQHGQSQQSEPGSTPQSSKEPYMETSSAPLPSHTSLLSAFLAGPTTLHGSAAAASSTPGSPGQGTGANTPAMPGAVDPLLLHTFPRLYIVLISMHGLVRSSNMELGRDADTGGQVCEV
jgi:hypothetical protein